MDYKEFWNDTYEHLEEELEREPASEEIESALQEEWNLFVDVMKSNFPIGWIWINVQKEKFGYPCYMKMENMWKFIGYKDDSSYGYPKYFRRYFKLKHKRDIKYETLLQRRLCVRDYANGA